jgi:hypothetical protein
MADVARASDVNQMSFDYNTTETIVEVDGIKFRQIEYKNNVYVLRLHESETSSGDLEMLCGQKAQLKTENQIVIST